MTETNETIAQPPIGRSSSAERGTVSEPRRLTRARDGRWLGGVCAGLGRHFGLNPAIYRIGFAALSLAGGTGILLYVAAWLVMPDDGAEDSIAAEAIKHHRDRPWLVIGVGLLAFSGLVGLSSARIWSSPGNLWVAAGLAGAAIVWWQMGGRRDPAAPGTPPPGEQAEGWQPAGLLPRRRSLGPLAAAALIAGLGIVALVDLATGASIDWRVVLAIAAVILGGLIAAGAATGHSVGSVVVLGLGVLAVLAVGLAIRVPVFAGVGDRVAHPVAFASVGTRYTHGIGNFEVDLQDVRFPVGETHVKATLGIGDLLVRVPANVTVQVDARAGAGEVSLFGSKNNGTSVHDATIDAGKDAGRVLVLDAHVGLGQVEVERG